MYVKSLALMEQERTEVAFVEFLKKEDELQSTTAYMKLPREYQGRSLQYSLPEESVFVPVMGLGAVGAVLCFLKDRAGLQNRAETKKCQLAPDYSEVLSRLIVLLGADMSIRTAWDKTTLGYNMVMEQGRRRKWYVYEKIYETSCQMKGGVSEGSASKESERRCGFRSHMKLGGLLKQNRKNGSKNPKNLLHTEMTDAFEQREYQVRRPGEEAGTKLLLPLFILLLVVMVVIAVPALIEFKQSIRKRAMGLGKELRGFWKDEQGVGVIELVLVLVALIGLVIISKKQIIILLRNILKEIDSQPEEVCQCVGKVRLRHSWQ